MEALRFGDVGAQHPHPQTRTSPRKYCGEPELVYGRDAVFYGKTNQFWQIMHA